MNEAEQRIATGVCGLDEILGGGLPCNATYLVRGPPGSGKTTLALQFLLEGARRGESGLYVTLSETRDDVDRIARSHGWDPSAIGFLELAVDVLAGDEAQQTVFQPAEVELEEIIRPIREEVERLRPRRVVIDSVSEIRVVSGEARRLRREVLALKRFFAERGCTALFLDPMDLPGPAPLIETLVHGVIGLEKESPSYGRTRRRLLVDKLRGVSFSEGYHDLRILPGGVVVFPRLVASQAPHRVELEPVSSGLPALDALLGGGVQRGTSTLLVGPAGSGKSTLAMQYAVAAAVRGERSALFLFDETLEILLARADGLGIPVREPIDSGLIRIRQVDPAELTAGEFADAVRAEARDGARIVVIDSLNGYLESAPAEGFMKLHLRELLTHLNHEGVATFTVLAQHGLFGARLDIPLDVSFLSDNVVLLRYFEAEGSVRQAISVFKKRSGPHERTIREFRLGPGGVQLGEPLREFQGVLTGVPDWRGGATTPVAP